MPSRKPLNSTQLVPRLLVWFADHARDLPWRHTTDPYAIWISEIMLQQTQVKTVIPYWERWLQALPTVPALAAAPEDRVLKLWEGLGYYSRARNLRAAAQVILNQHQGRFPADLPALLNLPGIGRYTAGAIASIAFNQPAPVLDGNVIRVLTRVHALPGDPREKRLNQKLWKLAAQLVDEASRTKASRPVAGTFSGTCSLLNQALMELGATVCTSRSPACLKCPLSAICRAYQQGRPETFPETAPRPASTARFFLVAVLVRKGRFLVRQRPPGGVNAGFWEFPSLETADDSVPHRVSTAAWIGISPAELHSLAPVKHVITRYRIQLTVFLAQLKRQRLAVESGAVWVTPADLQVLALTSAHRRIARQAVLAVPFERSDGGAVWRTAHGLE